MVEERYRRFEGKMETHERRKNDDYVAGVVMEMVACASRLKLDVNTHRQNPSADPREHQNKTEKMRDVGVFAA